MRNPHATPDNVVPSARRRLAELPWPTWSAVFAILLLCLAFSLASVVGLALHFPSSLVYFVWPPSVLVFVILLLSPPRAWRLYFLVFFPVHLLVEWHTVAAPFGSLALFYLIVWIQALAGVVCVDRLVPRPFALGSSRSLIALLLGAAAAALAEALTLAAVLALTAPGADFGLSFLQTVLADALTMVVLAPALLVGWDLARQFWLAGSGLANARPDAVEEWLARAGRGVRSWLGRLTGARAVEASCLTLALLAVGSVVFGGYLNVPGTLPALPSAILPLLLWAAIRFRLGSTSLALCGLTLLSIIYAIHGRGPFTALTATENLISLQLFFIMVAVPMLVLAVIMQERRHALVLVRLRREAAAHAAQLEAIFEAQADGVAVFDTRGRFVRANRALAQILGFDPASDYLSRPFTERAQRLLLLNEAGQPIPEERWPHWRVLRGEPLVGTSAMDARVTTLDGREAWISITGAPVRGHDGQITGVVLVTRDVTTRRAVEKQAEERAGQLEAIFEAIADGIVVFDRDARFVRANRAWQEIFHRHADNTGMTADPAFAALPLAEQVAQLPGHRPLNEQGRVIPLEGIPTRRALRGEVLTGERAVDEWTQGADGQVLQGSVSAAPVRDAAGNISGAVVVVRDVTARRRLEREVAERERQYRTLVEHSPDIITRFDSALRHTYVSPRAEAILGIPAHERLGKTYAQLALPEALYAPWERALRDVLATGEPTALDITSPFGGGDGQLHSYRVRYIPEFGADGSVESVLGITSDLTELKRAEQALREANARVEAARQEEERRKQIAESLRGVLAVLNSNQPPREMLDYIVRQVEELLGSSAAVIYGLDLPGEREPSRRGSQVLRVQAAAGLRIGGRPVRPHRLLPFADAAVGAALAAARPVLQREDCGRSLDDHPGEAPDGSAAVIFRQGALPAPYHALLAVPIRLPDGNYGCLLLFYRQPCRFSAEEAALTQAFADQVAQAITNARLQAHRAEEATAAERNRLARELHDTVQQEIFAARFIAESLPRMWPTHRSEAENALRDLHQLTGSALAGLRALLLELRPGALERAPLSQVLRHLGAAMTSRAGGPIAMDLEGIVGREPLLPAAVKEAFYRVAQEALLNAAKYAKARAIALHLRTDGKGRVELEVADDGQGFDPGAVPAGHFGLAIMRERAQNAGASVQVHSAPGQGTQVIMAWRALYWRGS